MKGSGLVGILARCEDGWNPVCTALPQERGDIDPLDAKFNGQVPGPVIISSISSSLTLLILIFKRKPWWRVPILLCGMAFAFGIFRAHAVLLDEFDAEAAEKTSSTFLQAALAGTR